MMHRTSTWTCRILGSTLLLVVAPALLGAQSSARGDTKQQGAAAPKRGAPPKPGMVSCAGKIEGRYATTGSAMGSFTIRFRSGTATMTDSGGNDEVFECWTAGDRIILRQPSRPNMDMAIDINDDGSLQTPIGEIRKKGS